MVLHDGQPDDIQDAVRDFFNNPDNITSTPVIYRPGSVFDRHPELLTQLTAYARARRSKRREIYAERRRELGIS